MRLFVVIILSCWVSVSWAEWPKLPHPRDAKVESIGEDVRLNGVPMRMQRILSNGSAKEVLAFYRKALGEKHAEMRVRKKKPNGDYVYTQILSQLKGHYFISVRVTQVGAKVTKTLLAISDGRPSQSTRGLPLGFTLPADSKVLSDMESVDAGKHSRQLVLQNKHSIATNENFLINVLRDKGYRLQPELTHNNKKGLSMLFAGDAREAMVVIRKRGSKTNIVMTTIVSRP